MDSCYQAAHAARCCSASLSGDVCHHGVDCHLRLVNCIHRATRCFHSNFKSTGLRLPGGSTGARLAPLTPDTRRPSRCRLFVSDTPVRSPLARSEVVNQTCAGALGAGSSEGLLPRARLDSTLIRLAPLVSCIYGYECGSY